MNCHSLYYFYFQSYRLLEKYNIWKTAVLPPLSCSDEFGMLFVLQHCRWLPGSTLMHTSQVQSFIQNIQITTYYLQSLCSILALEIEVQHKKIKQLPQDWTVNQGEKLRLELFKVSSNTLKRSLYNFLYNFQALFLSSSLFLTLPFLTIHSPSNLRDFLTSGLFCEIVNECHLCIKN